MRNQKPKGKVRFHEIDITEYSKMNKQWIFTICTNGSWNKVMDMLDLSLDIVYDEFEDDYYEKLFVRCWCADNIWERFQKAMNWELMK